MEIAPDGTMVRVDIAKGGCSGYKYEIISVDINQ